ncbi:MULTISPECIES: PP2C family serine/threonine-protein phosphatase [Emticicia]|uniref:PP2C family serine/threonine-protein phosphatase n=1 Tax=Emticicia TaxID=312278 RepID=UPI00209ED0A6|nr:MULTISPECIES: PP2C family serine/threonine-protein phosphatase [Emticicia]UTA66919.1 protein phosphatase 2C domain-containing protein [Emticicia sp. 21SJ11W-3]
MSEIKAYIKAILEKHKLSISSNKTLLLDEFVNDETNINLFNQIKETQQLLMDKWLLKNRIDDIKSQVISIPNGTVGKAYSAKIEIEKWQWRDIAYLEFEGLENLNLQYSDKTEWITGIPSQSGELKIKMKFRIKGEADDSFLNEKIVSLVINPDPKSLWKNIESDKNALFWKEDNINELIPLGDRHLVVASKRGRSHANVGSFRDDDYAFKHFEENDWSIVTVADGAGSAKYSRQGSKLACQKTIEFFETQFSKDLVSEINAFFESENTRGVTEVPQDLKRKIIQELYKITLYVHNEIVSFAKATENNLKDFHTTLIFSLFRKIPEGYIILSFGVGDCPIALLNREISEVSLLNWLDVGEYGGGTRFITMPEIFSSEKMSSRFNVKIIKDFSFLMLMTDGIYDPKFVVEANLEKIDKWKEFLLDLDGKNDENLKVDFQADNNKIAETLNRWLDFWSPGNHDDRTLAIIF